MGLDMSLTKKVYVKNWDHYEPKDRYSVLVKKGGEKVDLGNVSAVVTEIGDWRKANAIHNWFVQNTQGGDDQNGVETFVEHDKLQNLLFLVNEVLDSCELVDGEIQNGYTYHDGKQVPIMQKGKTIKDPTVAQKLLPTQSGFFFGSTNYDQYYYGDLVYTQKVLKEALKDKEGCFYYSSSW